jgi:hypothetical protein
MPEMIEDDAQYPESETAAAEVDASVEVEQEPQDEE